MFNDIYVSAFTTILLIEKTFGTHMREHAIRISKERYALREEIMRTGFESASSLSSQAENQRLPSTDRR